MARVIWDKTGERLYEAGVDHGVLYLTDTQGEYNEGYVWNGLTAVTESPSGAESNPQYADNIKYINLLSAEEFGATIEAFTYPDEFMRCDGTATPIPGLSIGQQRRELFGLSYRTLVGNDTQGQDYGYKIHLIYGAQAAPSEKNYTTINDSPEALNLSWEVTTTGVQVTDLKPTAQLVLNSTQLDPEKLKVVEDALYGTQAEEPRLPLPDEIIEMLGGAIVSPAFVDNQNRLFGGSTVDTEL